MNFKNTFLILVLLSSAVMLTNCGPKASDQETTEESTTAATPVIDTVVTTAMVDIGEANMEYITEGKGSTILLLPDAGLNTEYLKDLSRALAKSGYLVVRINPRGTGKSKGKAGEITMHTLADDVAGVIRTLQLGIVDIAGHGFGNQVARMFTNDNPALVRSIILISVSGPVAPTPEAQAALRAALNPKTNDQDGLNAMASFVGHLGDGPATWEAIKASRAPEAGKIQSEALKATPAVKWETPIGVAPLLVIQGSVDRITPPANGKSLQKTMGDNRVSVVTLPGAGHMLVMNRAQETADAMVTFLKKVESRQ
ncbi:MAG: alpha/beta hydrolase [Saprospiraceae bacterium]|nr:alpha/beta hydrolase [Saprospiraceae bacterium]